MSSRGNLPAQTTTFVGRESLLADVGERLKQARLVTLTGAGGVGKTRAAVQVGRQTDAYRHGVWLVSLAGLKDPSLLARTVAESLEIVDNSREAGLARLVESLQDKHLLLVLDNCEHLLPAVQHLVHNLLQGCAGVTVLATSREQINVYGEHIVRVPPLCVNEGEAVKLFVDRATATGAMLGTDQLPEIAEVCRLLDGLPLAIELAAARLGALSVTEIHEQLEEHRFALLVGGVAGPTHHQTLQRAFEWSAEHCSTDEQLLWSRLSVFPASFDRAAVHAVCGEIAPEDLIDLLTGLVRKSILIAETSPVSRRTRYRMLETVTQFGARQLRDEEDRLVLRHAHAEHYRALLDEATRDWFSPRELHWMGTLREEWPNIRVAIAFYLSQPEQVAFGAQMAVDVSRTRFACFAGMLGQTQDLLDNAYRAQPDAPSPMRLAVLANIAWIALIQGNSDVAAPYLRRARLDADGGTDPTYRYAEATQTFLGERDLLRAKESVAGFKEVLEVSRPVAAAGDTHMVELFVAMSACFLADAATADAATRDLLASVEEYEAIWSGTWALWTRALFELLHGDPDVAYRMAQRTLRIQQDIGDTWGPAFTLWLLACAAGELGAYERSARLFGGVRTQERIARIGFGGLRPWQRVRERIDRNIRRALRENLAVADAVGASMRTEQLIELALEEVPVSERRQDSKPSMPGGLTKQELTIAALVADGLTSKQIGERLFISPRTADRHVINIRTKLGLPNRVALASWHQEHMSQRRSPGPVEQTMDAALEGGDMLLPALYEEMVDRERRGR